MKNKTTQDESVSASMPAIWHRSVAVSESITRRLGEAVSWLLVVMVLTQFVIVLLRYVYATGEVWLTESLLYFHGFIIMCACGYTLLSNGHVRIDIFLDRSTHTTRARLEFFGTLFLLLPFCAVTLYFVYPYVAESWRVMEGSTETAGLQIVFLLKSTMVVFCLSLILQAYANLAKSFRDAFPNPPDNNR